ncbi:hypothetical protein BST81_06940 [Leptolyngbya sp. 'hensonii']|uniref:hypothetical protein n=1 Tax=Leptolyngbya sp. 'hensonii' TaxID=1922337 RepID=UPI00094FE589|nr:hypothetical protein [Leptolyngbya sp. 'hensonii']OLP18967.1 hypothetical protein BST81_06940 [Leptolyngbya sp. 'hensonii']
MHLGSRLLSWPKNLHLPTNVRRVLRPMLLFSLIFHVALFLSPTSLNIDKKAEIPKDRKSTKIRSIKLAKKPPKAAPKKAAPRSSTKTIIPPLVKPEPTPPTDESPSPDPSASPSPDAPPSPAPSSSSSPSPSASPTPAADQALKAFEELLGSFQDTLPATNKGATGAVGPDVLVEPEKFFKDEDGEVGQPGLESNVWIPLITPEETIPLLVQYAQSSGAVLSDAGTYGGGPVYKVVMGSYQRYFVIVPTSIKPVGTIIFIWNGPPAAQ